MSGWCPWQHRPFIYIGHAVDQASVNSPPIRLGPPAAAMASPDVGRPQLLIRLRILLRVLSSNGGISAEFRSAVWSIVGPSPWRCDLREVNVTNAQKASHFLFVAGLKRYGSRFRCSKQIRVPVGRLGLKQEQRGTFHMALASSC